MKKREERIGFEIRRLDHMLARNVQAREIGRASCRERV